MSTLWFLYVTLLTMISRLVPGANVWTYGEIATSLAVVLIEEPPLYADDVSRVRTAALVLAVGFREGSLRRRIHGDCVDDAGRPIATPPDGVCAHPGSYCTMQIHKGSGGSEAHNDDLALCFRTGLRMLRQSVATDRMNPVAFYARGPRYQSDEARGISRDRMAVAAMLSR